MPEHSLPDAIGRFLEGFVTAFTAADGQAIASLFLPPWLAVQADGGVMSFATQAQTAGYFQAQLDGYHRQGCRTCRYRELEVRALAAQCSWASVNWELLRDD